MTNPLKFCKDCKHNGWGDSPKNNDVVMFEFERLATCDRPVHMLQDFVSGRSFSSLRCRDMRADERLCGPDARWFEAKETAK